MLTTANGYAGTMHVMRTNPDADGMQLSAWNTPFKIPFDVRLRLISFVICSQLLHSASSALVNRILSTSSRDLAGEREHGGFQKLRRPPADA